MLDLKLLQEPQIFLAKGAPGVVLGPILDIATNPQTTPVKRWMSRSSGLKELTWSRRRPWGSHFDPALYRGGALVGAPASWSAAVLCRFAFSPICVF